METQLEVAAGRKVIAENLQATVLKAKADGDSAAAAECLHTIREEKLWRTMGFTSFNAYAKSSSCPYSSNHAYKLAAVPAAAKAVKEVLAAAPPAAGDKGEWGDAVEEIMGDVVAEVAQKMDDAPAPTQAVDMEYGAVVDTVEQTVTDKETGKSIEYFDDPPTTQAGTKKKPPPNAYTAEIMPNYAPEVILPTKDLCGNTLSREMSDLFLNAGVHFKVLNDCIHQMRQALRNLAAKESGASFAVHNRMEVTMQHLHSIEGIVHNCRPYSVCIFCSGNRGTRCAACGGIGFLTENQYLDATATRRK